MHPRNTFKPLVVSLDLEFNQPSNRIIQIGAVVGCLLSQKILSRFSTFVNPDEALNPFISELCGIAPEVLTLAGNLAEAYAGMQDWLAPFNAERQLNPLTWGGGDSQLLKNQLGLQDRWAFGRRWLDVKTVYCAIQLSHGKQGVGGLKPSMRQVGLPFVGRSHDALADAHNTFRMYCRLQDLIRRSDSGA